MRKNPDYYFTHRPLPDLSTIGRNRLELMLEEARFAAGNYHLELRYREKAAKAVKKLQAAVDILERQHRADLRRQRDLEEALDNPRRRRKNPPYDPEKAQLRAVVQGIFESLVEKSGRDADELSQAQTRKYLSQAFAIATRQGQQYGWLKPGTNTPTAKGRERSMERQADIDHLAENEAAYERTLARARKGPARPPVAKKPARKKTQARKRSTAGTFMQRAAAAVASGRYASMQTAMAGLAKPKTRKKTRRARKKAA
jgi:hypothetical protein